MPKRALFVRDELSYLRRMETRTNASDIARVRKTLSGQVAAHGRGLPLQAQCQAILLEIKRIDEKMNRIWRNPSGNETRLAKLQKHKSRLINRFHQIVTKIQEKGESLEGTWCIRKRLQEEYREGY